MSMWAITLSGSFTAACPRLPPADTAEPAQALAAFIARAATDPVVDPGASAADGDPLPAADPVSVVLLMLLLLCLAD